MVTEVHSEKNLSIDGFDGSRWVQSLERVKSLSIGGEGGFGWVLKYYQGMESARVRVPAAIAALGGYQSSIFFLSMCGEGGCLLRGSFKNCKCRRQVWVFPGWVPGFSRKMQVSAAFAGTVDTKVLKKKPK